jgi:hypothetical protein
MKDTAINNEPQVFFIGSYLTPEETVFFFSIILDYYQIALLRTLRAYIASVKHFVFITQTNTIVHDLIYNTFVPGCNKTKTNIKETCYVTSH